MQSQLAKNWKTYMCYMYTLTRTNCEVCSLKFFFQGKCYDEIEVVSEGIGKRSTIFKTHNKVALIFTTKGQMIIHAKKLPAHFFLGPDFYKMI